VEAVLRSSRRLAEHLKDLYFMQSHTPFKSTASVWSQFSWCHRRRAPSGAEMPRLSLSQIESPHVLPRQLPAFRHRRRERRRPCKNSASARGVPGTIAAVSSPRRRRDIGYHHAGARAGQHKSSRRGQSRRPAG